MLVMLTQSQVLMPQQVCPSCLLANRSGQPRWEKGQLGCGESVACGLDSGCPKFRCQMGFYLAQINNLPVRLETESEGLA
ncbi:hypothetical protein [Synechococcus sp. PCC 6312]|uniref:hypothetical protein n=1 Tax=Synechococcus sp. (strain ATCC 27167 / PCC 6312) TaxID=195253 RepID=UPI00029EFB3E|nr:hypothetical protein [Synechococcus sp. PCC 6312]AFY59784.1 hypothetical protein Syn6312_0562 [Synechococcus sp. PCC 6312]